ncbi:hypothetical protein SBY92_004635 [Candida maltosa Xu316]
MITNEFKLQLIIKSLDELGYTDVSQQLQSQLSSSTNYLNLKNWFWNSLINKNYQILDDYMTQFIDLNKDFTDFIHILNYFGSNYNYLFLVILYLIRRLNYLDKAKDIDENAKFNYLNDQMMPLLDKVNNNDDVVDLNEFNHVFDKSILEQLTKDQEFTALLNTNATNKLLFFGKDFTELSDFAKFLFKKLFKENLYDDIPNLATIIEQSIKYQQLQSPYFIPPRTKYEKKKQSQQNQGSIISKNFQKNFNPNKLLHTLNYHQGEVWFIKFSPSGKYLLTGSSDGKIILYDVLNNFSIIKILEPTIQSDNNAFVSFSSKPSTNKEKSVIYCAWDPKENYIVSCHLDTVIRVWSIGEIHKKRLTRSETSTTTTASNDFKLITCFTLAPDIKTWTCEFLPENKKITHDDNLTNTPQFIVGSPDKVLKIFNCSGVELFDFYANIEEDDDDDDHNDDHINNATKRDDISMKDIEEDVEDENEDEDKQSAKTATTNNTTLERNFNRINDLAITKDGKTLITINDSQLHFYTIPDTINDESATTKKISTIQLNGRLTSCNLSNSGNFLLLNSAPEELLVFDISSLYDDNNNGNGVIDKKPTIYKKFFGHTQCSYIIRSNFGYLNEETNEEELVLTGSDDGYIFFWKLHTGQLINRIKGHVGLCNGVDWNRNGIIIKGKDFGKIWASVGDDKLVKIWSC